MKYQVITSLPDDLREILIYSGNDRNYAFRLWLGNVLADAPCVMITEDENHLISFSNASGMHKDPFQWNQFHQEKMDNAAQGIGHSLKNLKGLT